MDDISVIILAAGIGRRMKSYGPKCLIALNNQQTVIQRQLDIICTVYPRSIKMVVLGFEAERVKKALPSDVSIVENKYYESTNIAYSLFLAMQKVTTSKVLIIYGDLVFNLETLASPLNHHSTTIIDSRNQIKDNEVGVTVVNNEASRFSYGLPVKWAQITYLTERETGMVKKIVQDNRRHKLFGFEILNLMLDMGGRLKVTEPDKMRIVEIDTSKDIELARKIV